MTERKKCYRLQVAENLYRFIEEEALPGTGIDSDSFWRGFDAIVDEMSPKTALCWPSGKAFRKNWIAGIV